MRAIYPFTDHGRQTVLAFAFPFVLLAIFCAPSLAEEPAFKDADPAASTAKAAPLFVHYMPWFASKPVTGEWGQHWTMHHFNPEEVDADGKRQIASHHYPLIGPYDSGDPAVLEYHTRLMKVAGIDGVIFDWYGIRDTHDHEMVHRNTLKMIPFIKRAGLKFAICYEDRTIAQMIQRKHLAAEDATEHGKEVIRWLHRNWFADPAYVQIDERPLVLVFGPLHFKKPQWDQIRSSISPMPQLCGLPHLSKAAGFDGPLGWPPASGGELIRPEKWQAYLRNLYSRCEEELTVGVAFPGFHDIYSQAGKRDSFGRIEERSGKTFEETLQMAEDSKSRLIQIATWNDFGEGTAIEPTKEFGFRYLEAIQRKRRPQADPSELRERFRLFEQERADADAAAGR